MKRNTLLIMTGAILLIIVGKWGIMRGDGDQIRRGNVLYAARCAACHGANLEGQPDWKTAGDDGRLPAPPHDASGHSWHHDDELLFRITKFGSEAVLGGDYKSNMKGFGGQLSDAEIRAILAFIKSTWPEEIRTRQRQISKTRQAL
jgi:mono/diheme cytochrome c family protein